MKQIREVKSADVHIEFDGDGKFGFYINSEDVEGNDVQIPLKEMRTIARTLSRIAVQMWLQVDEILSKDA